MMSELISNELYSTKYLSISRFVSVIFLNAQGLLAIIVAQKINDYMVKLHDSDEGNCGSILLVLLTLSILGFNLYWVVL